MKKALMLLIMCIALSFTVFAGGEKEGGPAEGETFKLNTPGKYPVVLGDTPYEIDVFTIYLNAETNGKRDEAAFTDYLEKLTNVRVNFEVADSSVYGERQNLLISSGDLPDAFMSPWGMNHKETFTYGQNGTLLPLTEYIETRMPSLKKEMEEYTEYSSQMYMPDGEIYALPYLAGALHVTVAKKMYMYMPWLEKLGLKVPETTEEFRNALLAFRDKDPNGNGKKDEIPLMGSEDGWNANPLEFIMNSFIYTNASTEHQFLMREGNDVQFVASTPEWRKGLMYMADLVADGLLASESFVQQNEQLKAQVEHPDYPLVGAVFGGHTGVFANSASENKRYLKYEMISPLKGPDGTRQPWYQPKGVNPHTKVTNAAERPDIITQWADYFYGDVEVEFLAKRFWQPGEEYRWATEEDKKTLITSDAVPPVAVPLVGTVYGVDKYNDGWNRTAPLWQPIDPLAMPNASEEDLGVRLTVGSKEKYLTYLSDHWLPRGLVFDPSLADEIADLVDVLVSETGLVQQWSTEFIIGSRDIRDDGEWEAYINALYDAGLERYVKIWSDRIKSVEF